MIPAEAVEAAAKRIAAHYGSGANNWEWYLTEAAEVLEAAAPHMMAGAWDEGYDHAESDHYGTGFWTKRLRGNPYRKPTDAHQ